MGPSVKRRSGQHHGDLRPALLAAALDLVAERGPRGFTVAEAARRAGVSSAAPYKHFADREALLAALAVTGYAEQERRFADALAHAGTDAVERLAVVARAYVSFAREQRALFDVVFGSGLDKAAHPDLAAAGGRVLGLLLPETRQLTADDAEAQELLLSVAALAHGHAVFLLEGGFGPVEAATPGALALVDRSVRALIAGRSG
jgi:AcrR family transcriptional regulator